MPRTFYHSISRTRGVYALGCFLYLFFSYTHVIAQDKSTGAVERKEDTPPPESLTSVSFKHANGKISSRGFVNKQGKPDGKWINFYPTGVKRSEGERKDEVLQGEWSFYAEDGILTQVIDYKDGLKNGFDKRYNKAGIVEAETPFLNNLKNGWAYYYYPDGKIKQEVYFINDKKSKRSLVYDQLSGQIIEVLYYENGNLVRRLRVNRYDRNDDKTGLWLWFNRDKIVILEGTFRRNLRHGYFRYYDDEGNFIKVERYIDGILQQDDYASAKVEVRRTFYKDKSIKTYKTYKLNLADGTHKFYDSTGLVQKAVVYMRGKKVEEGGYLDPSGRKGGGWKSYYEDGESIKSEGYYKNGLRDSTWIYYYRNGQIRQKGSYLTNAKEGGWNYYLTDGTNVMNIDYEKGKRSGDFVQYGERQRPVVQGTYIGGDKDNRWFYKLNDVRMIEFYAKGLPNGTFTTYGDRNVKLFEGDYSQGLATGRHSYYNASGGLHKTQEYRAGKREGKETFYDANGAIYLEVEYRSNEPTTFTLLEEDFDIR